MSQPNATACTLLGFLHDRPMTGWELSEAVEATIGFFWNVSRSQIYRELRSLEERGMVVGGERGAREKRPYTLTDAGHTAFAEWIAREPGPEVARYPLLISVWFGDHVGDERMDWFLRMHRARHGKRLEFFRRVYAEMPDESTPSARALRFGLFYEEGVMRWFDSLPTFGGHERQADVPVAPRPSEPARIEEQPGKHPPADGEPPKRSGPARGPRRRV